MVVNDVVHVNECGLPLNAIEWLERHHQSKSYERGLMIEGVGIQPGSSFQPQGDPARLPHEYVRGGTAKLLTLFRPATGEVRAEAVEQSANAIHLGASAMLVATGPLLCDTAWEGQEPPQPMPFLDAFAPFATTREVCSDPY